MLIKIRPNNSVLLMSTSGVHYIDAVLFHPGDNTPKDTGTFAIELAQLLEKHGISVEIQGDEKK